MCKSIVFGTNIEPKTPFSPYFSVQILNSFLDLPKDLFNVTGFIGDLRLKTTGGEISSKNAIDESQRAMVAAKIANLEKGKYYGNQHEEGSANLRGAPSQAQAADLMQVSERSVNIAERVAILDAMDRKKRGGDQSHSENFPNASDASKRAGFSNERTARDATKVVHATFTRASRVISNLIRFLNQIQNQNESLEKHDESSTNRYRTPFETVSDRLLMVALCVTR
ncbi:MAG: hypothetical protein ABW176_13085 [Candidatus Thiodiazotropha endolucinida]